MSGPKAVVVVRQPRAHHHPLVGPVLVLLLLAFAYLDYSLHYSLPTPGNVDFDSSGAAVFNEAKAVDILRHFGDEIGYRLVGTKELAKAEDDLVEMLNALKREHEASPRASLHQIELFVQSATGSHVFSIVDIPTFKAYSNITNIIARISDGSEASKRDAVLINAHLDSTLPSPGAADDIAGVAVMLEMIRIQLASDDRLVHAAVYLFNGAEESLQDGSHAFITSHELAPTVRGVLNLEACGTSGQSIVFQATSSELIKAYSTSPHPYATVLASEIFSSGVILSDSAWVWFAGLTRAADVIQFEQHGNLTALDTAIVGNSYLYHSRLDVAANIEPGALTHMAGNSLAVVRYLTSDRANISAIERSHNTVFFSYLGGSGFVVLDARTCSLIYAALAVVLLSFIVFRGFTSRLALYGIAGLGVLGSTLTAVVSANVLALIHSLVLQRSLIWFKSEFLPVLLYGPAALGGVLLAQLWTASALRKAGARPEQVSQITLVGVAVYAMTIAIGLQSIGILSAYCFGLAGASAIASTLLNDLLVGSDRRTSYFALTFGQIVPIIVGVEGLLGVLDLFDAPADHIIATIVAALGAAAIPMVLPLVHHFDRRSVRRVIVALWICSAAAMALMSLPSWNGYDRMHPKRIYAICMTNVTTSQPTMALNIAAADREQGFAPLVREALQSLDIPIPARLTPAPVKLSDPDMDSAFEDLARLIYAVLHPLGQLLQTLNIPLPSVDSALASEWHQKFQVTAEASTINHVTAERKVTLEIAHPGLIWTVIAFDADIISWSLSEPPPTGYRRHHIKQVSGYGVDRWQLELTVRLTALQLAAAQRVSQRRKGHREADHGEDAALAGLRIDYSGLDAEGLHPHRNGGAAPDEATTRPALHFMRRLDAVLPDYVDAMLLSAVAGASIAVS